MIPGELIALFERIVRWAVILWGGALLGGTIYLLTR
jgi:hypothetical protein